MKQKIIDQMATLVAKDSLNFNKYDKKDLNEYDGPFIWNVREGKYTTLLKLDWPRYVEYLRTEAGQYIFAQGQDCGTMILNFYDGDHKWYVYFPEDEELTPSTLDKCRRLYKNFMSDVLGFVSREGITLPTNFKIPVYIECEIGYLKEQLRYAEERHDTSLIDCLRRFHKYIKTSSADKVFIYKDYAERSFTFCLCGANGELRMNGGIIFHGYPSEGYKTGSSVQLTPTYGWSIHT